jgi:hypothetical protein
MQEGEKTDVREEDGDKETIIWGRGFLKNVTRIGTDMWAP